MGELFSSLVLAVPPIKLEGTVSTLLEDLVWPILDRSWLPATSLTVLCSVVTKQHLPLGTCSSFVVDHVELHTSVVICATSCFYRLFSALMVLVIDRVST